jgi:hypothetical protein
MKLKLCVLIAIVLVSCRSQPAPNWPLYVKSSLWLPESAKHICFYQLEGSYQVQYELYACYPGNIFIQDIIKNMASKGWQRQENDFLNPRIKLNHAKIAGGLWDSYRDKDGYEVYQWIDDWKDSQNNYVRYGLKYRENKHVSKSTCKLQVIAIFIPGSAMKQL